MRRWRFLAAVAGVSALVGALIAVATNILQPSVAAGLAAIVFALLLSIALLKPEFGLVAGLAYAVSPLSFYVLFRNTALGLPYPPTADLALDAAVPLGFGAAAVAGLLLRSTGSNASFSVPPALRRPILAIAALLTVTALIGVLAGNPIQLVLADLVPFVELGLYVLLAYNLVRTPRRARGLILVTLVAGALTAIVKLILYRQGIGAFGIEPIEVGGEVRPRLYQNVQFGWLIAFALATSLAAFSTRGWRECAGLLAVTALFGAMILLSFERGLWVAGTIAVLPVLIFGLRRQPKVAVPLVVSGLAVLVVAASLLGSGSGLANPISFIGDRLEQTGEQIDSESGLSHKRQDEAEALWTAIADDPLGWPLGHGLGAEYVGPTGIREGTYADSFEAKHYSFNWYLASIFRTGFVGLAISCYLMIALAAIGTRAYRRGTSLLPRAAGLAVMSSFLGLAVVSVFNPYLLAQPIPVLAGATVGMLAAFTARRPPQEDESDRIRDVYARYDRDPRVQARRDPTNAANVIVDCERIAVIDQELAAAGARGGALPEAEILDVGCGNGDELVRLCEQGAAARRCHGVDLLGDRLEAATERLPEADLRQADARRLPFADASMDIVVLKVVLSSVLDRDIAAQIAGEVDRVLRPGGVVIWYDNRYANPFNAHVRGITRSELKQAFAGYELRLDRVTVVPPLVRRLGRLTRPLYSALARIPPLSVRYAGLLVKPTSPASPHAKAPARGRPRDEPFASLRSTRSWILLAALAFAAAAYLLWLTKSYTFYYDEWFFVLFRREWSAAAFLTPHMEYWSTLPILVYKLLFATVGAEHYWPYMLVAVTVQASLATIVFVFIRKRAGDALGIAAASIVLVFGRGAENLIWAFQIGYVGAIALGLLAWWLIDVDQLTRPRAWGVAVTLLLAVMTAGTAFVVVIAIAVELVVRRRFRRVLLLLAPLLAYVAWYLAYGRDGVAARDLEYLWDGVQQLPGYVWVGLRAAAAGVLGSPIQQGLLALAGFVALISWSAWRNRGMSPRAIAAIAGILAVYLLSGLIRAQLGIDQANQQRYTYAAGLFFLILLSEALKDLRWRGPWGIALVVVAVFAVVANARHLGGFAEVREQLIATQKDELSAMEALRRAPGIQLDASIDPKVFPPEVTGREYFAAADDLGSPAPLSSAARLDVLRPAAVDRVAVNVFGPSVAVERVVKAPSRDQCRRVFPGGSDVSVASGSALVASVDAPTMTSLFLWLEQYPDQDLTGQLPFIPAARLEQVRDIRLHRDEALAVRLPRLVAGLSWHVRWAGLGDTKVCVLASGNADA